MADGGWSVEEPLTAAAFMFYGLHGLLDEAIATEADTASVAQRATRLFGQLVRSGA
jgi:hypothetical protein